MHKENKAPFSGANGGSQKKLLAARNIEKRFPVKAGGFSAASLYIHALNSVSFDIYKNSTLGLVGESGCGKTTAARTVLRVHEPDGGKLFFNLDDETMETMPEEADFFRFDREKLKRERAGMQYIFQDPYLALNPKMDIRDIVTEPAAVLKKMNSREKDILAGKLLDMVGLPSSSVSRFPHEFSGGQRQRISIARSISTNPKLVICDEPVSSLDVSIQSQILNLLIDLQKEFGLSYLFIAHNLAVVFYMSDYVAVMYTGRIVEYGKSKELYENPLHPYTNLLMSVVPEIGKGKKVYEKPPQGEVPSLVRLPPGCPFYSRCPKRMDICKTELPLLKEAPSMQPVSASTPAAAPSQPSSLFANSAHSPLPSPPGGSGGRESHYCACHAV